MITHCRLLPILLTLWAATLSPTNGGEVLSQPSATNSNAQPAIKFQAPVASIWQDGVGCRSTVQTFSVEVAVDLGIATFGSRQAHDFALISLAYGPAEHPANERIKRETKPTIYDHNYN